MSDFVYFEKLVINKNVVITLEPLGEDNSKVLTTIGTSYSTGESFEDATEKLQDADE